MAKTIKTKKISGKRTPFIKNCLMISKSPKKIIGNRYIKVRMTVFLG
jgi:hypothetical protein